MNLRDQLIHFEGKRNEAYPDPLTRGDPWTIGIGHTGPEVHEGLIWTDDQVDEALDADIKDAVLDAHETWPWFDSLNEPRQAVLLGMIFQMGIARTLKFVHTLADVRDERFANAAEGIRQSVWAKQTPKRAILLASQLETGNWA